MAAKRDLLRLRHIVGSTFVTNVGLFIATAPQGSADAPVLKARIDMLALSAVPASLLVVNGENTYGPSRAAKW